MPITKKPGVYFNETTEYELDGNGGKIPVFIGITNNTQSYFNFTTYDDANKTTVLGNGKLESDCVVDTGYIKIRKTSCGAFGRMCCGNRAYTKMCGRKRSHFR